MKINNMLLLLALSCAALISTIQATEIYLRNETGATLIYRVNPRYGEKPVAHYNMEKVGSDFSPEQQGWDLEIKEIGKYKKFSSITDYIKKALKEDHTWGQDLVIIINPTNPLKSWTWNITHNWENPMMINKFKV